MVAFGHKEAVSGEQCERLDLDQKTHGRELTRNRNQRRTKSETAARVDVFCRRRLLGIDGAHTDALCACAAQLFTQAAAASE